MTHIRVIDPSAFPFVRVDKAVMDDPALSIYDVAVYVALCYYAANETDEAYPSMKTLGLRARCSERQARSSVRALEEHGYIVTERSQGEVNVYRLTRSKHRAETQEVGVDGAAEGRRKTPARHAEGAAQHAGGAAQCAEGAAQHAGDPGTVCRRTRLKELDSLTKPPPTPQSGGADESFNLAAEQSTKPPAKELGKQAAGERLEAFGEFGAAIVKAFNESLPELPHCDGPGATVSQQLRARIREDPMRKEMDWWRAYFQGVRQYPFLMGQVKEWHASLLWLLGKTNMTKVLGGYYSKGNPTPGRDGRTEAADVAQKQHTGEGGKVDARNLLRGAKHESAPKR